MNQDSRNEKTLANIRRLVWLYFWLLIFEGALRKWVLPSFSNPLLIVRDPVLLVIYLLAIRARVFPVNGWTVSLAALGFLSLGLTFLVLWPYLPPSRIALVGGYGFRANFFHLPLIFLLPRVLRMEDVKRFGWWTLACIVPIALLMVAQFRASPDSFLNRTAGGEGEMMLSAMGKVRTAATFSFVVGVAAYFALASAFLIWAALRRDVFKDWLLVVSGSALVLGGVVSGSRSVVGACAVVLGALLVIFFMRPSAVNRFGQTLIVTLIFGLILTRVPLFREGFEVLSTRFNEVAEATEKSVGAGLIDRVFSDFSSSFFVLTKAPFLGYGLGIGTNAGAKFLTGQMMFLLSEGEWARVFLESGPVLGVGFILWRCAATVMIGLLCLRSVRFGNVLPVLLFSATFLPLMNGQFGQPTVLGFVALTAGLALAARQGDLPDADEIAPLTDVARAPGMKRVRGRSAYAARLHGEDGVDGHRPKSNGADHF